jgi:pimeloyl-ACP methyl ester carboxylesterase
MAGMARKTVRGLGLWLLMALVLALAGAAQAETDVTAKVQVIKGRLGYDRVNKQSYLDVSVKNISSEVLLTPIKVVVSGVTPSTISVANAGGIIEDGNPYLNFTTVTGQFLPGATIASKRLIFANPTAARFSYTANVLAKIPEAVASIDSAGGTVETADGIILEILPESLHTQQTITVLAVPQAKIEIESTIDNSKLLSAVTFGPSGLTFSKPVAITFPLGSPYEPGLILPLKIYDETLKNFIDSGFTCTVEEDGQSCVGQVSHFCTYAPAENSLMPYLWQFGNHHMGGDSQQNSGGSVPYTGEYAYFIRGVNDSLGPRLPNSQRDVTPSDSFTMEIFAMSQTTLAYIPPLPPPKKEATRLFSSVCDNITSCNVDNGYGKEPVLFIHGYQKLNNFGGGETYWGDFPRLIGELNIDGRKFVPFDFQWRTNARFQDIAEDLHLALYTIFTKMGNKKVHIVAHSFGGIVTRVMLQKYFSAGFIATPYDMVASVTTIGTPHSGIADSPQTLHGMDFPQGQDSWVHEGAGQISVHQLGEAIPAQLNDERCQKLEIDCAKGEIAKAINSFDNDHFLPNNLPFQVAIGLTGHVITGVYHLFDEYFMLDDGDKLISYEGQRFHPALTVNGVEDLVRGQNSFTGITPLAFITETILGLNGIDLRPGSIFYFIDESLVYCADAVGGISAIWELSGWGYKHSEGTKTFLKYPFSENVVHCASADTCNHGSFIAVKGWLSRYSSLPVHTFNLKVTVVDDFMSPVNGAEIHVYADGVSVNVDANTAVDGTAILKIPFTSDTKYTLEISHNGYQTELADTGFMTGYWLDSPLYDFGIVQLTLNNTATTPLNDTGITWGGNYPSGNNAGCTGTEIGAQDCSHGRDVTHNDPSDGHAGFSFTKLDANGVPLANQAADYATTPWACVQDNVTGLIWEVKTADGGLHDQNDTYFWYNTDPAANGGANGYDNPGNTCEGYVVGQPATYCNTQDYVARVNAAGWCGASDWRMPTRKELVGIVSFGRINPAIDTGFFPNTLPFPYSIVWSGSSNANNWRIAWYVCFDSGYSYDNNRNGNYRVRLVRSGQ